MMNPIVAGTIVLALLALGEVVSISTRARVPGFLITFVALFALLKTGLVPEDVVTASTFTVVGTLLAPVLLVHMGTLIPLSIIRQQYKAVLIAVCGMIVATLLIIGLVGPVFGYSAAVAGAGPLNGGLIATINTTDALVANDLSALLAVPLLVFILQQLLGLPLAANILRRYAVRFRDGLPQEADAGTSRDRPIGALLPSVGTAQLTRETASETATRSHAAATADGEPVVAVEPRPPLLLPERFRQSKIVLLFLLFAAGSMSVGLEAITGLDYTVWGIAIGITAAVLRVLPARALDEANGFTVAVVGLLFVVLSALSTITVEQIIANLAVVAAIIVVGTVGLVIGGFIGSKIFGWDPRKGIPVALTALMGFPLDYMITHEVARSIGRDDSERTAILNETLAPMLIGGFTTVTTGSVLIASILVNTL